MINLRYPATLAFLIGALLFFSACIKKDPAPAYDPPLTEPFTIAAAKLGDTLVIKGQNFSTVTSDNTVQFGNVVGTVVSATATEIKVIVPANAINTGFASGSVTITVTVHGNTTTVGTLMVFPLTLYFLRNDFNQTPTVGEIVAINPATGSRFGEVSLPNFPTAKTLDIAYLAATNEIVGVNEDGSTLMKVNVGTKQITSLPLSTAVTNGVAELVIDKSGNLYGLKIDRANQNHIMQSLVKIDPKTGNSTVIKTIEYNGNWKSLVYLPATNQVIGLEDDGTRLLKVNLTSNDTSSVALPGSSVAQYRELVVVDGSELYGYKGNYSNPSAAIADLTKINVTTGQETLATHLSTNGKIQDHLVYLPELKEIFTIWDQRGLFQFNVTSMSNVITSYVSPGATFGPITSN